MSTKIGKYDVLEILGRGGMGVVYKAYDPILDREVALKTMTAEGLKDPVLRERFYREARAAGRLRHPNIVTIYELGEENDTPYIAMEFLTGTDVHSIIRMRTEVAFDVKLRIIIQLCRGLSYAHKAGIVHRDIKPSNIRVTEDYHVKILDFGIARLVTSQTMTTNGMVLGTIHYMSPEQIRGAHVDRKSDIFSVGIILYELLSYKKPFEADNTATVLYNILHEQPHKMIPPIDDQFPVIKRVLQKTLDKDPARRYFTTDELADDLEDYLRSFGSQHGTGPRSTMEYSLQIRTEEIKLRQQPEEEKRPPTPAKTDPRTAGMLRTARRMITEGHAVPAAASLRQILQMDPNNQEAKHLFAIVENDIKRAETEELLHQGQQYLREGRYDIAMKAFEKIMKIDPQHSKAKILLETVKNEMLAPHTEELLSKARDAYANKRYQMALKFAEEVLVTAPLNQDAQELIPVLKERLLTEEFNEILRSAEDFIREEQYQTAMKALEKALKLFPQHPVAVKRMEDVKAAIRRIQIEQLILKGNKQLELGNYEESRTSFQEILQVDPDNETAKMVLGYIEEKLRVEEVQQLLNLGWRTLMMDRHYEEVIRIGEKILSLDPRNAEAQSLIGSARKEMKN